MAFKIVWSKTAEKQFDEIVDYLQKEWSETLAARFVRKCNEIFDLLKMYPEAGSIELREKRIRGFLVSKQVRLFYRLSSRQIKFLSFFDTRLSPEKKLRRHR